MNKIQYTKILETIKPECFGVEIPIEAICKHIGTTLFKKNGEMYRNPPTFREKPLASCFQRLFDWEFSGGNLTTVFTTGFDIDLLIRSAEDSRNGKLGSYWTDKKSNLLNEGIWTVGMTKKQLETFVTFVAREYKQGETPARQAWQRVLC